MNTTRRRFLEFLGGSALVAAVGARSDEWSPVLKAVGGSGSGAIASANVVDGVITSINIVSSGSVYTSPPMIVVRSA